MNRFESRVQILEKKLDVKKVLRFIPLLPSEEPEDAIARLSKDHAIADKVIIGGVPMTPEEWESHYCGVEQ